MSVGTKTCSRCGGDSDGLHSYCRDCRAAYARENRVKNPGQSYAAFKRWKTRNPEKWQRIRRNSVLKREFGITLHDFERMLEAQDFKCAICYGELVPWPHLDHDHSTGVVREILCGPCNLGIGHVKDDPDIADAMAAYLRRHSIKE